MAEVIETTTSKTAKSTSTSFAAPEVNPIEERTDVTVDELERTSLPYPAELYDGKVVYKMANPEHGMIQLKLGRLLDTYLEENPVGYAMTETNFRLWPDRPRESRVPDVAFVKKERMPEDLEHFPAIAPDLAIEILSPEDNFYDVIDKVDAYLQQGSQMVWLVISKTREVLVCTKEKKYSVNDILTAPELLPGFELPLEKVFANLPAAQQA